MKGSEASVNTNEAQLGIDKCEADRCGLVEIFQFGQTVFRCLGKFTMFGVVMGDAPIELSRLVRFGHNTPFSNCNALRLMERTFTAAQSDSRGRLATWVDGG